MGSNVVCDANDEFGKECVPCSNKWFAGSEMIDKEVMRFEMTSGDAGAMEMRLMSGTFDRGAAAGMGTLFVSCGLTRAGIGGGVDGGAIVLSIRGCQSYYILMLGWVCLRQTARPYKHKQCRCLMIELIVANIDTLVSHLPKTSVATGVSKVVRWQLSGKSRVGGAVR
jgi:hypothetical protein